MQTRTIPNIFRRMGLKCLYQNDRLNFRLWEFSICKNIKSLCLSSHTKNVRTKILQFPFYTSTKKRGKLWVKYLVHIKFRLKSSLKIGIDPQKTCWSISNIEWYIYILYSSYTFSNIWSTAISFAAGGAPPKLKILYNFS